MKQHLLFLHGALGAKSQFDPFIPFISDRYIIHSLDFRGHGSDSFDGALSIKLFIEDVINYMTKNNIEKCNIFGYSMGGYVAVSLAALHPERVQSIMTLGTKWHWNPEIAEKESKMLDAEAILAKVPAFAEMLNQRHKGQGWRNLLQRTAELMKDLGNTGGNLSDQLNNIPTPVLICLGAEDKMVTVEESERTASQIPLASFKILESVPHPLEKVSPALLAGEINQFFG